MSKPWWSSTSLLIWGLLAAAVLPACGEEGDEPAAAPESVAEVPKKSPFAFTLGQQQGRFHEYRTHQFDENLTDEQRAQVAQLEAIGYAEGVHEGEFPSGVTRLDVALVEPGLNLLTSAHEPGAMLINTEGDVLHRWSRDFAEVWPDYPGQRRNMTFWRRVHLFENGDLLAIYEGLGIIRVDKDSNLLWASPVRAHHDLEVLPDGRLWVLSREARVIPSVHEKRPVMEDFISLLDSEGQEVRRISILDALVESEFSQHWSGKLGKVADIFHTNSLALLDGSLAHLNPAFAEGNFLISILKLDLIAVLDPEQERIVWALKGDFNHQHDPSVLPTGKLLLFDNNPRDEASRLFEVDPGTGEQTLVYAGSGADPFYSETCGVAQRLPNENTLVTESDYGRAFEVTPDGTIVWEYYNPFRAGEDGRYIATMMEMRRLPADFPVDWAAKPGAKGRGR